MEWVKGVFKAATRDSGYPAASSEAAAATAPRTAASPEAAPPKSPRRPASPPPAAGDAGSTPDAAASAGASAAADAPRGAASDAFDDADAGATASAPDGAAAGTSSGAAAAASAASDAGPGGGGEVSAASDAGPGGGGEASAASDAGPGGGGEVVASDFEDFDDGACDDKPGPLREALPVVLLARTGVQLQSLTLLLEEGAPLFDWAGQSPPLPSAKAASWSPDGRMLAIITGRPKGSKRGGGAPGAAPAAGDGADAAPAAGACKDGAVLPESGLNVNAAEFAPAGSGLNASAAEFVPGGAGAPASATAAGDGADAAPAAGEGAPASAPAAGDGADAAPAAGESRGAGQDDQSDGLVVVEFSGREELHSCTLNTASKCLQLLQWSPLGTFLVVQPAQRSGEDDEIWRRAEGGEYTCVASLPSSASGTATFQWTADEKYCCQLPADGVPRLTAGDDILETLWTLPVARPAQSLEFAPPGASTPDMPHCVAVFVPDTRDSLQRVVSPAEVAILDVRESSVVPKERSPVRVTFGQQAELKWSHTGSALLAHCTTDVDDTGQSYYGGSKLVVVSQDAGYCLDLTEAKDSVVQAVSWCPTRDEFILIQGFQPARVTCWKWDAQARECSQTAVLQEKMHRNTIRWNHFGSMVCIAGFGNLAGKMDFFGRSEKGLQRVSSCEATCTVHADWAPDGRHLLTAVLAPRMRVDNGLSIWSALTGFKAAEVDFDELLEAQWAPEPSSSSRFTDITPEEFQRAASGQGSGAPGRSAGALGKKQAYRPPSARDAVPGASGSSRVAQMMRGELPETAAPTEAIEALRRLMPPQDDEHAAHLASLARDHLDGVSAASGGGRANEATPRDAALARLDAGRDSAVAAALREPQKPVSQQPVNLYGDSKKGCPEKGWEYVDPKGKTQGPFTLEQMKKWFSKGLFKPELKMRCDPADRFTALKEMYPHPMVPFHAAPKRPA